MDSAGGSGFLLWTILGIILGVGLGVLISLAFRKSGNRTESAQTSQPRINAAPPYQEPPRRAGSHARRCPVCNSTYTDESLSYCVSDGSALLPITDNSPTRDPDATVRYREAGSKDVPPTEAYCRNENLR